MAARHVAATAPHVDLAHATLAFSMSSGDTPWPCVKLLCRVCQLANVLCNYSELSAALIICEWVGSESRRGVGLWDTCVEESQQASVTSVHPCLRQLGRVYEHCSMYDDASVMYATALAMLRRIHGDKDHSDVAISLGSLAHVYRAQGRLNDSASLHEESLAMKRRIHGNNDQPLVTDAGRCDVL